MADLEHQKEDPLSTLTPELMATLMEKGQASLARLAEEIKLQSETEKAYAGRTRASWMIIRGIGLIGLVVTPILASVMTSVQSPSPEMKIATTILAAASSFSALVIGVYGVERLALSHRLASHAYADLSERALARLVSSYTPAELGKAIAEVSAQRKMVDDVMSGSFGEVLKKSGEYLDPKKSAES
ncbi:hypothetical protein EON82_22180 [bacterium]|nr:MAG: hypothetical protein EON82_22180 [bacterium]